MQLRVLTFNLPGDESEAALRGEDWDVTLLAQAPERLAPALARAVGAEYRQRAGLAVVARVDRISAERARRLGRWPSRRWVHGVQLGCGLWFVQGVARTDADAAAVDELAGQWTGGCPALTAIAAASAGDRSPRVFAVGPVQVLDDTAGRVEVRLLTP